MTVRPIIFSGPMVRALLEGRKTQTRRLATSPLRLCQPGDLLFVRESIRFINRDNELGPRVCIGYEADGADLPNRPILRVSQSDYDKTEAWWFRPKRPSIHMPQWASRLTLEVQQVRSQRLDAITNADAIAEGATKRERCSGFQHRDDGWCMDWSRVGQPSQWGTNGVLTEADVCLVTARCAFLNFWNTLHGEADDWPEVVALTFTVHKANVDDLIEQRKAA